MDKNDGPRRYLSRLFGRLIGRVRHPAPPSPQSTARAEPNEAAELLRKYRRAEYERANKRKLGSAATDRQTSRRGTSIARGSEIERRLPRLDRAKRLRAAVKLGEDEAVAELLNKDTQLNFADQDGNPLLWYAIDSLPILDLLLSRGARPDVYCAYGWIPVLSFCLLRGKLAAASTLLEAGADLELRDFSRGATPLVLCCTEGLLDSATFLLERGANVAAPAFFGSHALRQASAHGHLQVVEYLLGQGAHPCHGSQTGRTAREAALAAGHSEIERVLETAWRSACEGRSHIYPTPLDELKLSNHLGLVQSGGDSGRVPMFLPRIRGLSPT